MKITRYHTVAGDTYIYEIPVKDSKPKSQNPDKKSRYKFEWKFQLLSHREVKGHFTFLSII